MRKRKLTRFVGVLFSEEAYRDLVAMTDAYELPLSSCIRLMMEEELKCWTEGNRQEESNAIRM